MKISNSAVLEYNVKSLSDTQKEERERAQKCEEFRKKFVAGGVMACVLLALT